MRLAILVALLPLVAADLSDEHAGDVFNKVSHSRSCVTGVLTTGNSTGEFRNLSGINTYFSPEPPKSQTNSTPIAIMYLTDIFGVQQVNNRLLGDSIALAGYHVIMPDLFNGDPVPADALTNPNSTFNMTAWSLRHPVSAVDAIVNTTINSIRGELGFTTVGAVGYCFGGKYVAQFLAAGNGLDAGFAAHPSGWTVEDWEGVANPISIAYGALDTANTIDNRTTVTDILQANNETYQTVVYSNAEHGFAVRTDLTIPQKAFAQESAYFQAIRWFDAWLKDEGFA